MENVCRRMLRLALDLYNCIYGKYGVAAELKSCRTVKDCAEATVKFAEASGLEASVRHTAAALVSGENTELSETYLRIWNIFTDVAEQAALFLGDVKIHGYKKLSGFFRRRASVPALRFIRLDLYLIRFSASR